MLGYCLLFSFKQGLALSYFRVMQTINSECLINAEEGKKPQHVAT